MMLKTDVHDRTEHRSLPESSPNYWNGSARDGAAVSNRPIVLTPIELDGGTRAGLQIKTAFFNTIGHQQTLTKL